jgi:transcriptional regulator with XRE-family HTH domain
MLLDALCASKSICYLYNIATQRRGETDCLGIKMVLAGNITGTTESAAELQMIFASNLRILCGYYPSVAYVCRRLGINRTQFNRYLAATARPSANILNKICNFFGVEATEIHLPTDKFEKIIKLKHKFNLSRPDYINQIDTIQRASRADFRKYLGFYYQYYFSMSFPGKIIKGLTHFFEKDGFTYVRRIEHFQHHDHPDASFKCRYVGAAFYLNDRIFITETETLTGNEITETILFPTYRNKVGKLAGLVLGVSAGDQREIACSRVVLEWLGTEIDLRRAIRSCGLYDPPSPEIGPHTRAQIDNSVKGASPLFYASAI